MDGKEALEIVRLAIPLGVRLTEEDDALRILESAVAACEARYVADTTPDSRPGAQGRALRAAREAQQTYVSATTRAEPNNG